MPGRRIVYDSSDEEDDLVASTKPRPAAAPKTPATTRRRKLGILSDNVLLRPFEEIRRDGSKPSKKEEDDYFAIQASLQPGRTARPLRQSPRKTSKIIANGTSTNLNLDPDDSNSAEEHEITELFFSAEGGSDFDHVCASSEPASEEDESDDSLPRRHATRRDQTSRRRRALPPREQNGILDSGDNESLDDVFAPRRHIKNLKLPESWLSQSSTRRSTTPEQDLKPRRPITPPKAHSRGLTSPKKLPRPPQTPHHHASDHFWDREFVDEWNDEHSPKKQLFLLEVMESPSKESSIKADKAATAAQKAAKKAFEDKKDQLAIDFLHLLDSTVTDGQIQQMALGTGGVQIVWSKTLNTTAGRARWKKVSDKTNTDPTTACHRHHATIELAHKVIDDEDRLLNVIAHEFCHLATFMITGVSNNPHGRDFKSWGSKVSAAFGKSHGIKVTTKHSYAIDWAYIWTCDGCAQEYKRHSKSIDTDKQRCGRCKGKLTQIKPVPRKTATNSDSPVKKAPSDWQVFMKERMKSVKAENPKSPQKEILKLVAAEWAEKRQSPTKTAGDALADDLAKVSISGAAASHIKI